MKLNSPKAQLKQVAAMESSIESLQAAPDTVTSSTEGMAVQRDKPEERIFITKQFNTEKNRTEVQIYIFAQCDAGDIDIGVRRIVTTLSQLNENDLVDIILTVSNIYQDHVVTLASAIETCKATIHTHASYISGAGALLIWLSGDKIFAGIASIVRLVQMKCFSSGDIEDVNVTAKHVNKLDTKVFNICIKLGFITKQEALYVIKQRKELNIYGNSLTERTAKVNSNKRPESVKPDVPTTEE